MLAQQRQERILEHLRQQPRLSVTELQRTLGMSRSSLRRDLLELEQRGELLRVHGGVVLRGYLRGEPTFDRRRDQAAQAKDAIARCAASLVGDQAAVYVDAGTTCLQLARHLLPRKHVRLFTNSLALLEMAEDAQAGVICIGGELRPISRAFIGGIALDWLNGLSFDIAFMGASGLSPAQGLSTTDLAEAQVKRAAMSRAGCVVLLADASKWDHPAPVRFATWKDIDTWVTDKRPPRTAAKKLCNDGMRLQIAEI